MMSIQSIAMNGHQISRKASAWKAGDCFVSDKHRFIYVQVPKAACTSIKAALLPLFSNLDTAENASARGVAHIAFRETEYKINKDALLNGIESGEYVEYFRFSFVRNPWDRLLSCYKSKVGATRVSLRRTDYEGGTLYPGMGFREFAEIVCKTPDKGANMHFRSQTSILSGSTGELVTNFVGYFENIAEDFVKVCNRIDQTLELPHVNPSKRGSYRKAYDTELVEMVGERYQLDVEAFGYSF